MRVETQPERRSRSALAVPEAALAVLRPLAGLSSRKDAAEKRIGGKAAQLARWAREGFLIPPAWVIDARTVDRAMELALPRDHDVATLVKLDGTAVGIDRAARAHERVLTTPLPDDVRRAIDELWRAVEPFAPWGLAVRSSATCEDGDRISMAGLAESVLGVRGPEAIEAAVRRVWASLVLPRTLAYLRRAGVRTASMPALLQVMVRAEAAGVAFSRDPLAAAVSEGGAEPGSDATDVLVVSATLGLGAPVVDGAVAADLVRVAPGGAVVSSSIVPKPRALVVGDRGVEEIAVPDDRVLAPALDEDALRDLERIVRAVEARAGHPVDVEFAVDRDEDGASRVWLLQARAITVATGFPEGGDASTVWSRANVGEALPGAATPLTWSVARGFAEVGFREAFQALGCKVPKGSVLVAGVHGRFYLNLTQFARIAAQVPGMSPATLLEASGGASPSVIALLEKQVADVSSRRFLVRAPLVAPRLLARQERLEREIAAYEPWADKQRRRVLDMDLGLLPDDALTTSLRATQAMLERTGSLMLVAASASLGAYVMLRETLARVLRRTSARGGDAVDAPRAAANRLAIALTGGVTDLESAAPGLALARVARLARTEPDAEAAIVGGARRLDDLPRGTTRAALLEFLESWGERAMREAELSVPRWSEDPAPLLAMLAASLRSPAGLDVDATMARARAVADRELLRLETSSSRIEVALVKALVGRVQRFTRARERMRFWVTRVLGMLRRVALEADRRLVRIDPRLPPGAVFFCTFDELCAALASGRAEIGHVLRLRRAEHLRDAARPDPPPTFVGRPPLLARRPGSSTRLVGLPASSGVVEGPVRVLGSSGDGALDTLEPGEILVARTTDVGLTPLFLVAAGVVTELGGPLSHAAIVAREYGVPAIVDVEGATVALRNGDRVRLDGDRGIVELLDERPDPGPAG